jgi:hypothetical protein
MGNDSSQARDKPQGKEVMQRMVFYDIGQKR